MLWFSNWIVGLQSWGKGSRELEDLRRRSESTASYDHLKSGRRLPEAEPYVRLCLQAGAREASSRDLNSFAGVTLTDLEEMVLEKSP